MAPRGHPYAVISAHRNPHSSRATAVATTFLEFFFWARRRNLPHRRAWAVQARATVSGARPLLAPAQS